MMYGFTEEFFRAARISLANSQSPYKKEALDLLDQSQQQIRSEYTVLASQYGDLSSQITKYNNLLDNIRKQKYMLATLSNPRQRTKEPMRWVRSQSTLSATRHFLSRF